MILSINLIFLFFFIKKNNKTNISNYQLILVSHPRTVFYFCLGVGNRFLIMYGKIFGYILSHLHHIFLHIQQSLFYSFIHRSLVSTSKMVGGGFNEGGGIKNYPGELTRYVMITCIVAAMGGLIFGYDIGISGNCLSSIFFFFFLFFF